MAKSETNDQLTIRREKTDEMRKNDIEPFGVGKFDRQDLARVLNEEYSKEGKDELDVDMPMTKIAGRILAKHGKGKVGPTGLYDRAGKTQIYIRKDIVGEDNYKIFKKLDIGDFLGIDGRIMRAGTDKLTICTTHATSLPKALRPLPNKWDGLKDVEQIYRQRYLDLITNHESYMHFVHRTRIIQTIRNYLSKQDFLEIETPTLHNIPGGAEACSSITHHNTLDIDLYMRIALELPLKRLTVGGIERVYEVDRVFRNEGVDTRHNLEFIELETYAAYWGFHDVMDEAEEIVRAAAKVAPPDGKTSHQGTDIDLDKPSRRVHMVDLTREKTGVDFRKEMTDEEAKRIVEEHGIHTEPFWKASHVVNTFFDEFCGKTIVDPTFVYGHPAEISPFAKKNADDPRFTDRFEIFILGMEYGNAFSGPDDPVDQRHRSEERVEEREAGDDETGVIDENYVRAMEFGMPPTGGLGISIDRLAMFLTNAPAIRDVLLFLTMRPEKVEDVDTEV